MWLTHTLTPPPNPCRTPFYMAPEIISSGEATKSSDVFSFAVMSIELCTGRPPWVRNGKGQFEPNKDFLNLPSHTPDGFRDLWTDCLQNDPKGRPTFAEIVVRLISMQIAEISQADLESDAGLCCLDVEGEGSTHFS